MTWTAQKYARNRSNGSTLKNVSLRHSWHAMLYPFQVYDMVIQRVYTLCRAHHGVSIVTIYHHATLLQHYWLYSLRCTFHFCDLFITGSLCFLTPPSPQMDPLWRAWVPSRDDLLRVPCGDEGSSSLNLWQGSSSYKKRWFSLAAPRWIPLSCDRGGGHEGKTKKWVCSRLRYSWCGA